MIRVDTKHLSLLAGLWMLLGSGCGEGVPPTVLERSGSARVVFVLPHATPEGSVARVTATAQGDVGAQSVELQGAGVLWQGWLSALPDGKPAVFRAEAFDPAGTLRFQPEVTSEPLEPSEAGLIILTGDDAGAAEPSSGNAPPIISSVVGSKASVAPGETVRLRALARDPDAGDELSYTWQTPEGTFDDASAAAPTWTAPASEGTQTVTLLARDSHGSVTSLSFTLEVASVASVNPQGPVVLNRWPAAAGLVSLSPRTVSVGQEVTFELQGAVDADSDPLTYEWTATCEGSRVDGSGATFRFIPTLPETTVCDNCQVSVRVEDAYGGSASYSLGLCVKNPQPPTIRSTSPSLVSATPGELLRLSVSAFDPDGGALTYHWTANTGILGVPVQTGDTSEVPWTALSCVPTAVTPTIDVTVTTLAGLSLTVRYQVNWSGPVCGHPPCDARLEQLAQPLPLLTLQGDCTTDTPVFIPDGLMLDGVGHELVAVDPANGSFLGAILRNHGATAHVRNLRLRAQGLLSDGPCDGGDDRLRGILLLGASGSVVDSEVLDIHRNQPSANSPDGDPRGCQEGHAIEVRNRDASVQQQVEIRGNHVSGYQKVGIVVAGRVNATIAQNTVTGSGPVAYIAQNGVQLSDGATGQVTENQISNHAYTGSSDVASGVIVAGGPYFGIALVQDALVQGNTLTGNDVGIYLDQAEADGSGPATPTRIRVLDNALRNDAVTNALPYQAGIADLGGGNIIHSNTITGAGYDPATQPGATFDVDVVAGPASQVAFLTPAGAAAVGACSSGVVVQSQDSSANLSKPTQATFNLTASGAAAQGLTFYTDAACTGTPTSTVSLSTPDAAATFYFKATQPGTVTLAVSNGSLSSSQDQTITGP